LRKDKTVPEVGDFEAEYALHCQIKNVLRRMKRKKTFIFAFFRFSN